MVENKDVFSTTQQINFWLFADMLDGKKRLFEFVSRQMYKSQNGNEIPIITLLGSAKDKRNESGDIVGEFYLSVWNIKPTKEFKKKYPSWKDLDGKSIKLELWVEDDKIICEESTQETISEAAA
jgi:hypothetical protein